MKYSEIVFFIALVVTFVVEGLGIKGGHQFVYFLILSLPFFLFILDFLSGKPILFPKTITIVSLFLFSALAISSFFSMNLQSSVERTLLYVATYYIFIYTINHSERIKRSLPPLIVTLGIFFSLYSIILYGFGGGRWPLVPISATNLVFSSFPSHNPLGDLLLLPIVIILWQLLIGKSRRFYLLLFIFFFSLFLFSYSRSAYLSLIAVAIYMVVHFLFKKTKLAKSIGQITIFFVVILSTLFFLSTVKEADHYPPLASIRKILVKNFSLSQSKSFLAERPDYFERATKAIIDRPIFGYGPGNFPIASLKYSPIPFQSYTSSHNLFFDFFVEAGLAGGVVFVIFLFLIFLKSRKDSVYFFLLVALFIDFQTFDTFTTYSLLMLFFISMGLVYEENRNSSQSLQCLLATTTILIVAQMMIFSGLLAQSLTPYRQLQIYPLSHDAMRKIIFRQMKVGNYKNVDLYLERYKRFYNGDATSMVDVANVYLNYDDEKSALIYLTKAYEMHAFEGLDLAERIYWLKLKLSGKEEALKFATSYFQKIQMIRYRGFSTGFLIEEAKNFCVEVYERCPYNF